MSVVVELLAAFVSSSLTLDNNFIWEDLVTGRPVFYRWPLGLLAFSFLCPYTMNHIL